MIMSSLSLPRQQQVQQVVVDGLAGHVVDREQHRWARDIIIARAFNGNIEGDLPKRRLSRLACTRGRASSTYGE